MDRCAAPNKKFGYIGAWESCLSCNKDESIPKPEVTPNVLVYTASGRDYTLPRSMGCGNRETPCEEKKHA